SSARAQAKVEGGIYEFLSTYIRRRARTGNNVDEDMQPCRRAQVKAKEGAGEFARSGECRGQRARTA
ncbi:hypothetical protein Dimus_017879, partial [Dionaea muscipula]